MTSYTRQATFIPGDVVKAEHGNDEFNQLVAAFSQATGHTHSGITAEGAYIPLISDATNTDKVEIVTGGAKTTGNHEVTGNITVSGTFDGRDIAVDGAKLDTIESNAKDDQSAAEVVFTPTGDIVATDTQAAIAEVATDTQAAIAVVAASVFSLSEIQAASLSF